MADLYRQRIDAILLLIEMAGVIKLPIAAMLHQAVACELLFFLREECSEFNALSMVARTVFGSSRYLRELARRKTI